MIHRVKTEDGVELQGMLYTPQKKVDCVVLHCHGMAGNFYENRFVNVVGVKLVAEGIAFCAMNNRGHDFIADFLVEKSGKIECKRIGQVYERIEDSVKDIVAWINYLKNQGYNKVILMGHSLGAVKAVLYAKKYQDTLSGLVLASPPDMLGLAKAENDFNQKMEEAKELVLAGKDDELLNGRVFDNYPISAGTFLNFFSEGSEADVFPIKVGRKSEQLSKVKLPMFVIFGEKDNCFEYDPKGITAFFKKNTPTAKMAVIPRANHVYLGEEHAFAQEVCGFVKIV